MIPFSLLEMHILKKILSVPMQPLNICLANKLHYYTILTECVAEIPPLAIHRLQDRWSLWMGSCNCDKFAIIWIEIIQRRVVWELFKRIL